MSFLTYSLNFPRDILRDEESHPLLLPLLPLETGYFEKAAGHGIFRRGLDEHILIYCVEGKGYLELEDPVHPVEPGTVLVCPPRCSHRYWADPETPWSIYWVHYKGSCVPEILSELGLGAATPCLKTGVSGKIKEAFSHLADCFRKGHGFPHIYGASAALHALFSTLITAKSYQVPLKADHPDMEELLEFLRDNLARNLSLDELAGKAGISKYHFTRLFTEAVGIPPMAYFIQLKIRKACEILDTTGRPIKEISQSLGFNSPYYFSESFKRITGMSPSLFRRNGRRAPSEFRQK